MLQMKFKRHIRTALSWFILTAMSACAWALPNGAWRLEPASSTHLIEISQGSQLSKLASSYRYGGFESASGQWVNFEKWYRPKWTDVGVAWMTQISPQFGMLWGLSTGEQAEKYSILPSLKLGVVYQTKVGLNASFSIRATSILGGRMRERTCTANYGDIGGIEDVNCRLAASEMAPAETLKQLTNSLPLDRNNVWIRYIHNF
jgi:hypothetical protein